MTEILLAHSFFLKNDAKQLEKMRPYPPLGTLYAASELRNLGYQVAFFDATFAEGLDEFESMLDQHQPQIVVLYEDQFHFLNKMCLAHAREAACRMSRASRDRGATVIAAGSDVTDHPEAYFAGGVQFALTGEGDHALCDLIGLLTGRKPVSAESIGGLVVPAPDSALGLRRNAPAVPERHPDVFPFPAWDFIDAGRYRRAWLQAHGFFSLNMVSTRGCPFHCNWCSKPIWGQRYAMRSPANVAQEMALLKWMLRPDHIWFADDIFGLQPQWVAEFAREVTELDAAIPFMIQSRVDLMTEAAVAGLARAGCVEVWIGVESGSQKILDAMDKGIKVVQVPAVTARLRDHGVRACFFLQFGYPGETMDDIMATVRLVRETLPDDIGISVSYPLPGTKFHRLVKAELGEKNHWNESNDLEMMFRGRYQSSFYRRLHKLLHRDLLLRHKLRSAAAMAPEAGTEIAELERDWAEWMASEPENRNHAPTRISKDRDLVMAPDLSKRWN
jgi:anaerobic magnesium-protoporphyrin IX monomethyl ester cyclase